MMIMHLFVSDRYYSETVIDWSEKKQTTTWEKVHDMNINTDMKTKPSPSPSPSPFPFTALLILRGVFDRKCT